MDQDIPNRLQWFGLLATLVGTLFSIGAFISALFASSRAREARDAAIRAGRVARLSELIEDMQELQTMLARSDFPAISAKCGHLRGRIARFKTEAYTKLREQEIQELDIAREQLEIIGTESLRGKLTETNRRIRIQTGFGKANEALNRIVASHGQEKTQGD